MQYRVLGLLFRLMCIAGLPAQAVLAVSQGDRIAEPYKSITVRVVGEGDGFGFVVGMHNDSVFIITPKHVIDGERPRPGQSGAVNVYFYQEFSSLSAQVIARDPGLDMALLRVIKTKSFSFESQSVCTRYKRSDPVWWVGQDRTWRVPLDHFAGQLAVNEADTGDRIEFNAIGIKPGVSGAPLIGEEGIIGMVIEDAPPTAYALDIDKIRRFARSKARWALPDCSASGISTSTSRAVKVKKSTSCWDGWSHKKVCHDRFKDGSEGPAMVLLSGGTFTMGSDSTEADSDEKPPRSVRVASFAIAQKEVIRAEFRRFVEQKNYSTDAEKSGSCYALDGSVWKYVDGRNWRSAGFEQGPDHPVTCVSWNDAQAYVAWLSRQTSQTYRLPTEAEWEYAARGGSSRERYWGNDAADACEYANVADETSKREINWKTIHPCEDNFVYTMPVGRKRSNGFGLYDVLGNVWEWTCSLYKDPYDVEAKQCGRGSDGRRALRGGSWGDRPEGVRSAYRSRNTPDARDNNLGFRVARIR